MDQHRKQLYPLSIYEYTNVEYVVTDPVYDAGPSRSVDCSGNEIAVTLGVDLLQKISSLFGEGIVVEKECSVRLPLWLLKQLYCFWQNSETSLPSSREGVNDAEIAAAPPEEEDEVASASFKKVMTVSQKLQLKNLIREFSMFDS
uniref:Sld5 domain-containing protein n=1 Tax=Angiostrongylus cantonensis TaxID=6313 RepID=A0A0K0D5W6_ANGCA